MLTRILKKHNLSIRTKIPSFWGTCAYCQIWSAVTKDHVIPRSKGGKAQQCNILLVCHTCNKRKDSLTLTQWLKQLPVHAPQQQYASRFLDMSPDKLKQFYLAQRCLVTNLRHYKESEKREIIIALDKVFGGSVQ